MSDDLRVKVEIPIHFKTKKLAAIAGAEGVFGLFKLWCYARTNRPKGDLYGLSESDINIICDMDGNRMRKRIRIVCAVFMRMRILRQR